MTGCQHQANKDNCSICQQNERQWRRILDYAKEHNLTPYEAMCSLLSQISQTENFIKSFSKILFG